MNSWLEYHHLKTILQREPHSSESPGSISLFLTTCLNWQGISSKRLVCFRLDYSDIYFFVAFGILA